MLEIWSFEVGDTAFCVWPRTVWVKGKGWVEAKEGYQTVTAVENDTIQTDISKGWVSVECFIKIHKKKPVVEEKKDWDWESWNKIYYLKDTHAPRLEYKPTDFYGVGGN